MPTTTGRSTSIFNFLSLSNSQGSGPLALGLEGPDWVSGLTFPGNPTRLKHSNFAKALSCWRESGKIILDREQKSRALLRWGGYIPFLSLTPTPALTPETPLTLDWLFIP